MAYATQQDLDDRFGAEEILQLSDRDADGVADSSVITNALTDADELINSYLAVRMELPLSTVPAVLVRTASDIAYCLLFRNDPPDGVKAAHEKAVKFLQDVSKGTARLDAGGAEPEPSGDTVQTSGPSKVFTRDTMDGF